METPQLQWQNITRLLVLVVGLTIIIIISVKRGLARSHVVCLSVCDVGGSGPHRDLEILETNCMDN